MLSLQALIQTLLTFVWANLQDVARTTGNALLLLYQMIAGDSGTSLVFQPGGVAAGNVYTTWASLYAMLPPVSSKGLRAPSTIQIDTTFAAAAIPAGAYNVTNVTFVAAKAPTVLTVDVGVTLSPGDLSFVDLVVVCLATASVMTSSATLGGSILLDGSALTTSAGGAFLEVPGGYAGAIEARNGSTVGDGTHVVLLADDSGDGFAYAYSGSSFSASSTSLTGTITKTFDASSTFSGAPAGASLDQSSAIVYSPASPSNWSPVPDNPASALDTLAAKEAATLTSYVFQPGGVAAGNVYTTWAALYAALPAASTNGTRPFTVIRVDDSFGSPATIPSGAYNLDGVTFEGVTNFNTAAGGAQLNVAVGVTIAQGCTLRFRGALQVEYLGTTACISQAAAAGETNVFVSEGCIFEATSTGPFLHVTGGFGFVYGLDCQLGDGTHALATCSGGGTLLIDAYANALVEANAMTVSAGGTASLAWDSDAPGSQGAGVIVTNENSYVPAVPGNWPGGAPSEQNSALDALAASQIVVVTQNLSLANLQAAGAVATFAFNLGAALPAGAYWLPYASVKVTTALAATGLASLVHDIQASAGDVTGAMGSTAGNTTGTTYGCTTPANPYPLRGGQQIVDKITLTTANFSALTAGALVVQYMYFVP